MLVTSNELRRRLILDIGDYSLRRFEPGPDPISGGKIVLLGSIDL